MFKLVINTWRTRNVSWLVKAIPEQTIDIKLLEEIAGKISTMPFKYNVPKHFGDLSFPRYYLLLVEDFVNMEDVKNCKINYRIYDIIGVRLSTDFTMTPTWWGYKTGYWHPLIQLKIVKSIYQHINEIINLKNAV